MTTMIEDEDCGPFAGMDPDLRDAVTRYGTPPIRETIMVTVRDISDSSFDGMPDTIDGWIAWLEDAREAVPPEYQDGLRCALNYDSGYYDERASSNLSVWYERPETDEEMKARVGGAIAYVRQRQQEERRAYEALKAKYEPGA